MRRAALAAIATAMLGWFPGTVVAQGDINVPQLRVTTDPEMADISFDGALQGQSPLTLSNLRPGPHLLSLTKPGYREIRQSIELAPSQRMALNLAMEPITGLLLLHSAPSGAEVGIDGAHRGKTPLLLTDLPLGRYRLSFSMTGYLSKDIDLSVENRTPQRVVIDLTSSSATLILDSTPRGADVTLNGISKGITPCTIERVAAGANELRIALPGYRPFHRNIRLAAGQTEMLTASLNALPATLHLVTEPSGARMYVDDEFRGQSPLTLAKLKPGIHRLRAELEGYDTLTRSLPLRRAQVLTEELRLVSNSGAIEIITHPAGVRVLIDGKEQGVTVASENQESPVSAPLTIDMVKIGQRSVQLVREGYFEKTVSVDILRQQTTALQESLKRRFIPNTEIKTPQGVYKGVFIDEDLQGKIRLEIRPGVIKSIEAKDIVSREPIK